MSAATRGWKGFAKAVPFLLLFAFLSLVYLLTPMAAPVMAAVVEPERFDWLFGGYAEMLLASEPRTAEMLDAGDDVLIGVLVVGALLFAPLIVLTFMRLVWLPAMWLWGELEDQVAAGIKGFVKVGVTALLPFIIALGFAFVLGGSTRGAIAYGGCTLFLPQVLCVLLGMTATELTSPSRGGLLHVLGSWIVAIPLCVPAYLCIFVLEPSPVWWAVEHVAMLIELVLLFRVLGNDHEGKTLFEA